MPQFRVRFLLWPSDDGIGNNKILLLQKKYIRAVSAQQPDDFCLAAMAATIVEPFPSSLHATDESVVQYLNLTQRLVNRLDSTDWSLDQETLSRLFPGASPDPYIHCMVTIFCLSFYDRTDIALLAYRHFQFASKVWPSLKYVTDNAKIWIESGRKKTYREGKNWHGIASQGAYRLLIP